MTIKIKNPWGMLPLWEKRECKDCWERKGSNNYIKKEKAEKAIDGDEEDMVLCSLTMESKKENLKKKFGWQKM